MNRGSAASARPILDGVQRFNEAPIHESGKFRRHADRDRTALGRFNEAPIHESGK